MGKTFISYAPQHTPQKSLYNKTHTNKYHQKGNMSLLILHIGNIFTNTEPKSTYFQTCFTQRKRYSFYYAIRQPPLRGIQNHKQHTLVKLIIYHRRSIRMGLIPFPIRILHILLTSLKKPFTCAYVFPILTINSAENFQKRMPNLPKIYHQRISPAFILKM